MTGIQLSPPPRSTTVLLSFLRLLLPTPPTPILPSSATILARQNTMQAALCSARAVAGPAIFAKASSSRRSSLRAVRLVVRAAEVREASGRPANAFLEVPLVELACAPHRTRPE